jgi:hypothetical protein
MRIENGTLYEDEPIRVLVSLDRYDELVRKAEHYDNIVEIAIDNAKLSTWKEALDLDTDTIEKYLLVVEAGKLYGVKRRLLAEKAVREKRAMQQAETRETEDHNDAI